MTPTKKKRKKKKDITKTDAWNMADWEYSGIIANDMMPLLSEPLRGQERINAMKEILDDCRNYYPAMLDIGQNCILAGRDSESEKWFDKGFKIIKEYFHEKDLIDAYEKTCGFLTKLFRYESALGYYNELAKLKTTNEEKADVYNDIIGCYVYLDNVNKAIEVQQKAVELSKCAEYYSNLGWLMMIKGDLDKAEESLKEAVKLDKKDEYAKNNFKICKLMKKKGIKNWNDYLLREIDYDELEKLENDERFDEYDMFIREHNACLLEAFKFELLKNRKYTTSKKHDIYFTLTHILNFIHKLDHDCIPTYDNCSVVELYFKTIMHKFIFKTSDINDKLFDDVYTCILEFYGFLKKHGLVSKTGYKDMKKEMLSLKSELREKMRRYNEVRHNPDYSEEEKGEIRDELFEGDHEWWFL